MGLVTDWEKIFDFMEYINLKAEIIFGKENRIIKENMVTDEIYHEKRLMLPLIEMEEWEMVKSGKKADSASGRSLFEREIEYTPVGRIKESLIRKVQEEIKAEEFTGKWWNGRGSERGYEGKLNALFWKNMPDILGETEREKGYEAYEAMMQNVGKIEGNSISKIIGKDNFAYDEIEQKIFNESLHEKLRETASRENMGLEKDTVVGKIEKSKVKKLLEYAPDENGEHGKDIKIELNNVNNVTKNSDIEQVTELLTQRICDIMQKSADGFYM